MKEKLYSCLGTMLGVAAVIGLLYLGIQWQHKKEQKYPWKGTLYKIVDSESQITDSKDMKTLDECRKWANDRASYLNYVKDGWDYSCGTGCQYKDDSIVSGKQIKTYECKELKK